MLSCISTAWDIDSQNFLPVVNKRKIHMAQHSTLKDAVISLLLSAAHNVAEFMWASGLTLAG